MKIDKEFQGLIPSLTEDEYQQLEANIIADGCRDALVTWNGILIDDHNRYRICQENDIPFATISKDFPDREAVIEWIIRNQFGRRNLTPFQRAELALKLKPVVERKAKERQENTHLVGPGIQKKNMVVQKSAQPSKSRDELAAMAGISHDTLKRAETIMKKGTPEQVQRAREGGNGNRIGTIYNEIVTGGIETQVCSSCGKELPIKEFYANKKQCKACCDRDTKARRQKAKEPPKEAMKAMAEQICDKIRNPTGEVVFTIDDLVEELRINIDPFIPRLRCILNTHPKLITVENQAKIKAVLSEAETAIQKFERSIIYE